MLIHRLKHPRTPPLYHSMVQTFTVWTSWHVQSSDDKYPWPECGKLTPVTTRQVRLWVHNNKLKTALMLHTSTDCSYSTLNFFQWLLSWLLHRISVTNLSLENNLPTFWLNAPVVIRASVWTNTAILAAMHYWGYASFDVRGWWGLLLPASSSQWKYWDCENMSYLVSIKRVQLGEWSVYNNYADYHWRSKVGADCSSLPASSSQWSSFFVVTS